MSVTHKYIYTAAEDAEAVNFSDWLTGLTQEETEEYTIAERNRAARVRTQVALGKLVVEYRPEMTYVWVNAEAATKGILLDANWTKYHDRYLAETNTTFEVVTE